MRYLNFCRLSPSGKGDRAFPYHGWVCSVLCDYDVRRTNSAVPIHFGKRNSRNEPIDNAHERHRTKTLFG